MSWMLMIKGHASFAVSRRPLSSTIQSISSLRSIIDLLKLKKDSVKTDLEIEALERKKQKEESKIHIAQFDETKRYDPRVRKLYETVEQSQRGSPGPRRSRLTSRAVLLTLLQWFLAAMAFLVYFFFFRD